MPKGKAFFVEPETHQLVSSIVETMNKNRKLYAVSEISNKSFVTSAIYYSLSHKKDFYSFMFPNRNEFIASLESTQE